MLMPNLDEIMVEIRASTEEKWLRLSRKFMRRNFRGKVVKRKKKGRRRSGSEDEDFLSKEGFELMQKTLLKKGFIGERGFKEIIPPFKEVIEKRGWISICKHLSTRRVAIIREFYANLQNKKET